MFIFSRSSYVIVCLNRHYIFSILTFFNNEDLVYNYFDYLYKYLNEYYYFL